MGAAAFLAIAFLLGQVSSNTPTPAPAPPNGIPIPAEPTPAEPTAPPESVPPGSHVVAPAAPLPADPDLLPANIDNGVSPPVSARDQSSLAPVRPAGDATSAPLVLSRAMAEPAEKEEALSGRGVTLLESLGRLADRRQQLAAVKAYWDLSVQTAEYHFTLDELSRLDGVAAPRSVHEQAMLDAARAAALARKRGARLKAVAAQHELADRALLPVAGGLPLAADRPFLGAYRTNFRLLFPSGAAPTGLRRIDATLPLELQWIDAEAAAVKKVGDAVDALAAAYRSGQVDLAAVLQGEFRLRTRRRAFLAAVRAYNHDIANYALSVAGPAVGPERIVSMLIETTPRTSSVLVPGRVIRRTAAVAPADNEPADEKALDKAAADTPADASAWRRAGGRD